MDVVLELQQELLTVEERKHTGTTQLAYMIAPSVGVKGKKPDDFLPPFAVRPPAVPQYVKEDLNYGIDLGMVSQELMDAMREIELRGE